MKQESEPTNVFCLKCKCWMWRSWARKTEEGYICNECDNKEKENEQILEDFQKVGEANFGSRGLK